MRISTKNQLFTLAGVFIGGILTLVGIYYGFLLQRPYLQLNAPDIEVYYPFEDKILYYHAEDLIKPAERESLRVCARNKGRIESSVINYDIIEDPKHNLTLGVGNIPKIQSNQDQCEDEDKRIRQEGCYAKGQELFDCSEERFLNGTIFDLIFNFRCDNCIEEQKSFNKTYKACIWRESRDECMIR